MAKQSNKQPQEPVSSPFSESGATRRGVQRVNKAGKSAMRHARRFVSSRLDRLATVKRMVVGWIVLVLVLIGISAVQWIGFRAAYMTEAPTAGGTFSEGVIGPLESLNPLFARTSAEKSAAKLMFAGLYTYDTSGNLKGDIADSVAINEGETEYTVKLRSGVVWSDGVPLTAKDVVFTVNLMKNPETRAEISGWESFNAQAVDATTVKFTLPGAYAPFLHSLTFPILPEHILADVKPSELRENWFSQAPVTSGPFAFRLLQNVSTDESKKILHLVANPSYLHGAPLLERFQLNVYGTREDIEEALQRSEISATPALTYDDVAEKLGSTYNNQPHNINDGVFAIFNTQNGVTSNISVRQALALATDRQKIREVSKQEVDSLDGPILSSQIEGDLPTFPTQDIKKAQELLDNEGWRVSGDMRYKDGTPLEIRMIALRGSGFTQVTNELADMWRKELKIKVDVQVVDPLDATQNVLQSILQPRNFDVLVYELVLGGDPDVYAYWHSSQAKPTGLNFANYRDVIADDALSGARSKRDEKYRSDRYRVFIRRWLADMPAVPLYQSRIDYIHSTSVKAMDPNSVLVLPEDRYADVLYWSVGTGPVYRTP